MSEKPQTKPQEFSPAERLKLKLGREHLLDVVEYLKAELDGFVMMLGTPLPQDSVTRANGAMILLQKQIKDIEAVWKSR